MNNSNKRTIIYEFTQDDLKNELENRFGRKLSNHEIKRAKKIFNISIQEALSQIYYSVYSVMSND
ncbi:MAG: hypothetical protein DRI94_06300 [Bacteroidetes bacterium]|nr:MAG: hypothetical protein DRI94_06300 [Bacteroidota bacterium]